MRNIMPKILDDMPEPIEPVMIHFENEEWVHPNIQELLNWEIDGFNPGKWSYEDLTRIYIENDKNQIATLVVLSKELYDDKISMDELKMMTQVTLLEDVWMPGSKQFCFTKFGKKLSKAFGQNKMKITFVSPDVGVNEKKDGTYSWSS
jgi:hypothetical protein